MVTASWLPWRYIKFSRVVAETKAMSIQQISTASLFIYVFFY